MSEMLADDVVVPDGDDEKDIRFCPAITIRKNNDTNELLSWWVDSGSPSFGGRQTKWLMVRMWVE